MAICKSCGIHIPDGQKYCSMCYGDPYYGRDGHYLREQEEAMRRQEEESEEEK